MVANSVQKSAEIAPPVGARYLHDRRKYSTGAASMLPVTAEACSGSSARSARSRPSGPARCSHAVSHPPI